MRQGRVYDGDFEPFRGFGSRKDKNRAVLVVPPANYVVRYHPPLNLSGRYVGHTSVLIYGRLAPR